MASHHPWKGSATEDQSCRDAGEPCQQMVTDPSWELTPFLTAGHGGRRASFYAPLSSKVAWPRPEMGSVPEDVWL